MKTKIQLISFFLLFLGFGSYTMANIQDEHLYNFVATLGTAIKKSDLTDGEKVSVIVKYHNPYDGKDYQLKGQAFNQNNKPLLEMSEYTDDGTSYTRIGSKKTLAQLTYDDNGEIPLGTAISVYSVVPNAMLTSLNTDPKNYVTKIVAGGSTNKKLPQGINKSVEANRSNKDSRSGSGGSGSGFNGGGGGGNGITPETTSLDDTYATSSASTTLDCSYKYVAADGVAYKEKRTIIQSQEDAGQAITEEQIDQLPCVIDKSKSYPVVNNYENVGSCSTGITGSKQGYYIDGEGVKRYRNLAVDDDGVDVIVAKCLAGEEFYTTTPIYTDIASCAISTPNSSNGYYIQSGNVHRYYHQTVEDDVIVQSCLTSELPQLTASKVYDFTACPVPYSSVNWTKSEALIPYRWNIVNNSETTTLPVCQQALDFSNITYNDASDNCDLSPNYIDGTAIENFDTYFQDSSGTQLQFGSCLLASDSNYTYNLIETEETCERKVVNADRENAYVIINTRNQVTNYLGQKVFVDKCSPQNDKSAIVEEPIISDADLVDASSNDDAFEHDYALGLSTRMVNYVFRDYHGNGVIYSTGVSKQRAYRYEHNVVNCGYQDMQQGGMSLALEQRGFTIGDKDIQLGDCQVNNGKVLEWERKPVKIISQSGNIGNETYASGYSGNGSPFSGSSFHGQLKFTPLNYYKTVRLEKSYEKPEGTQVKKEFHMDLRSYGGTGTEYYIDTSTRRIKYRTNPSSDDASYGYKNVTVRTLKSRNFNKTKKCRIHVIDKITGAVVYSKVNNGSHCSIPSNYLGVLDSSRVL